MPQFDWTRGVLSALGTPEEVALYDKQAKQRAIRQVHKKAYALSGPSHEEMPVPDVGEDPRKLVYSHQKAAEGLRQLGLGAEADTVLQRGYALEAQDMKLQMDTANAQAEGLNTAFQLAAAGNEQGAMVHANMGRQPGERITSLIPADNNKFTIRYENGKEETIDPNQMLKAVQEKANMMAVEINKWSAPETDNERGLITQKNPQTGKIDVIAKFTPPSEYAQKNGIADSKLFLQYAMQGGNKIGMDKMAQGEQAYGKLLAAAANPSQFGQHALIFQYMKVLDPGSTVREGEFATVQNAASVPEAVRMMWNKLLRGEFLTSTQVAGIVSLSKDVYHGNRATYLNQAHTTALTLGSAGGVKPEALEKYWGSAVGATDFSALEKQISDTKSTVGTVSMAEAISSGNRVLMTNESGQQVAVPKQAVERLEKLGFKRAK